MATILVTGGAGYIGSHACKLLAEAGHQPVVYDNLHRGHAHAVRWGPLERGDILDSVRLTEAMARHRPAAVLHFAALAYVEESVANPALYHRNNVDGSRSLLEAMRAAGVKHIVFSSTCAVYGNPRTVPIAEDAELHPISPYGETKLAVERLLEAEAASHGLKGIALRFFNVAGADPKGEIGEEHVPETHLIPMVLEAAAGKRSHVTVMGNDYETPDGTCVRDYVHVADIARAHLLALERLDAGLKRRVYNLGTGRGTSVAEIIAAARKITGRPIEVVVGPRRPGDPAALHADPTRAFNELGWQPQCPGIEDMIETAWKWYTRPTSGGR